jgi:hypothetical protein
MAHSRRGFFRTFSRNFWTHGSLRRGAERCSVFFQSQKPDPFDHGLLVILSQDATPEPSDSGELKDCLGRDIPRLRARCSQSQSKTRAGRPS